MAQFRAQLTFKGASQTRLFQLTVRLGFTLTRQQKTRFDKTSRISTINAIENSLLPSYSASTTSPLPSVFSLPPSRIPQVHPPLVPDKCVSQGSNSIPYTPVSLEIQTGIYSKYCIEVPNLLFPVLHLPLYTNLESPWTKDGEQRHGFPYPKFQYQGASLKEESYF